MEYRKTTRVEFVEVIGDRSFVIECRYCEGQGKEPYHCFEDGRVEDFKPQSSCSVCGGKRLLRIESSDIPTYDGRCNGTGKALRETSVGVGPGGKEVKKYWESSQCPDCKGLGVRSITGTIRRIS